jgi:hypothetical protein
VVYVTCSGSPGTTTGSVTVVAAESPDTPIQADITHAKIFIFKPALLI